MEKPSDRLKIARKNAGFPAATAAAEFMGARPSTYMGHENGSRAIDTETARRYARAFRVAPEWILFGGDPTAIQDAPPDADLVPVYDLQAGAGPAVVVYDETAVAQLAFPPGYLAQLTRANPRDLAILGVKGDSMLPTLADDDLVMIDRSKRDLSYDGLFVIRDEGEALMVKRIGRASRRGFVSIISDNRAVYPAVEKAIPEVEVVGRVIWKGGKV